MKFNFEIKPVTVKSLSKDVDVKFDGANISIEMSAEEMMVNSKHIMELIKTIKDTAMEFDKHRDVRDSENREFDFEMTKKYDEYNSEKAKKLERDF